MVYIFCRLYTSDILRTLTLNICFIDILKVFNRVGLKDVLDTLTQNKIPQKTKKQVKTLNWETKENMKTNTRN